MTDAQTRAAGWFRFTQVKQFVPDGQVLYRSSAPNYKKLPSGDHDASQTLTEDAVKFISDLNIDSIISFNKYAYKPDQLIRLQRAKIAYLHLPVHDGGAPTLDQLKKASDFFFGKGSTLVHAGHGLGRTATGVTALQIATVFGQALEPYASTWCGTEGNQVETRRQVSALAEFRNALLQNKIRDVADIGPAKHYAIINAATGYYLTISQDNKLLTALSPETVEHGPKTKPKYLWTIDDKEKKKEFTLVNRVTPKSFAITKAIESEAKVENGPADGANNLFTIKDVSDKKDEDSGYYGISPKGSELVVSIHEPGDDHKMLYHTKQVDVVLSDKEKVGKFGQWIALLVPDA